MLSDSVNFKSCYYSERLLNKLSLLNEAASDKVDLAQVKKAIYYARLYHGCQRRLSGEPYYSHPLEVAYMVCDYLFKTDVIVASILHDTIEDTILTAEMIAKAFGEKVAGLVEDVTRVKSHGKISSAEMVEQLWQQNNHEALIIKQFDRLHNMQTISSKDPERIQSIVTETASTFLHLAAYLQSPVIEEELYQLCYKQLKHHDKSSAGSESENEFCY